MLAYDNVVNLREHLPMTKRTEPTDLERQILDLIRYLNPRREMEEIAQNWVFSSDILSTELRHPWMVAVLSTNQKALATVG